jgi:hypothetical protein
MKKSVLVCIAKDEDHYIEEWLDYNHKLGFDEIVMYENDWVCPIDRPYLKKITFNGPHKQMESYNHFLRNFRNDYEWAAFLDCDEFLVLKKHNNVNEFLTDYNNPSGIGINWQFFGSCGKLERTEHKNSLIKQFLIKQGNVDQHVKTILKLSSNGTMVLPHNPSVPLMDTNRKFFTGPYNKNGDVEVAQINHYHHKTFEDWLIRCKRGQSDNCPTKTPDEWHNTKNDFCQVEDRDALKFMYSL